jgi:ribosomal protein L40E
LTVRPYWLWPPPARAFHARVSRSIGCRCDASFERQFSGVVRGHRRALRRTGPRPPARRSELRTVRRHCGSSWLRRSGGCASPFSTRLASEAAKWRDDQPDASLEVCFPCSARLPHRAFTGRRHLSGHPASTVGPRCPSSFALVIAFARDDAPFDAHSRAWRGHRAPTHRIDAGCPCGFSLGGNVPVDFARINAARFGWDASAVLVMRRCIARTSSPPRVMRRRCLAQPAFRYPRLGSRGLVGPLFGVAKLAWVSVP